MMRIVSWLLLSLSIFFYSGLSSASTITWWTVGQSGTPYASSAEAIRAEAPQLRSPFVTKISGTRPALETWQIYANPDQNNVYQPSGYAYFGTRDCPFGNTGFQCNASCPAPKTMVDGQCVAPGAPDGTLCSAPGELVKIKAANGECVPWGMADQPSNCAYLAKQGTIPTPTYVRFNDAGEPQKAAIDKLGCIAQPLTVAHCKQRASAGADGISIQSDYNRCLVPVNYTGEVSPGATSPMTPGNTSTDTPGVCVGNHCKEPDEPIVKQSKPCSYYADGEGMVSCQSTQFEGNPGEMNCGSTNGGPYKCTAKVPTSNGIKIETTVKTESTPDGGTKTTKTDKITQVKCVGVGSCVTNNSTNTGITIKDSGGKTTSQTGSCTGTACSSGGKGDSDGDGVEDCAVGSDCDEEGGGEYGSADLPVTADALPEIGEESDKTYQESTSEYIGRIKNSPIVSAINSINVPSGGSCNIGSASLFGGTVGFNNFCTMAPQILSGLRYLFLAIWAWAAVRLFMMA